MENFKYYLRFIKWKIWSFYQNYFPSPADPTDMISEADIPEGVYYYELPLRKYINWKYRTNIECQTEKGAIIKIFATTSYLTEVPMTGQKNINPEWEDITKRIYGKNSLVIEGTKEGEFLWNNHIEIKKWPKRKGLKHYDRFLIQYTVTSGRNLLTMDLYYW